MGDEPQRDFRSDPHIGDRFRTKAAEGEFEFEVLAVVGKAVIVEGWHYGDEVRTFSIRGFQVFAEHASNVGLAD